MSYEVAGIVSRKVCGGATRKMILMVLAARADDDGGGIWASVNTIARDAEVSESTARRALQDMTEEGLLRVVGNRPCRHGYTVEYAIQMETLLALPSLPRAHDAVKQSTPTPVTTTPVTPVTTTPLADLQGFTPVTTTPLPVSPRHPNLSYEYTPLYSDARASDDFAEAVKQCVAAAGPGLADPMRTPSLHTTQGSIAAWLRHGCDLETDILPVIRGRTMAPRASPISTWRFFDAAVYAARDARLAPPPPQIATPSQPQATGAVRARDPQPAKSAAEHAMDLWRARQRVREAGGPS
jgi:hypothetical protein